MRRLPCRGRQGRYSNDNGKAGDENGERKISNVNRKHLIALLQNSLFKEKLMEDDGPIDRIYARFAENKSNEINDSIPEFHQEDFQIDTELYYQILASADEKARKIAKNMIDDVPFINSIKAYVNLFVEKVIQRCAGLEPGDLANVIEEIRQELFKQGKILTILIEDITAASVIGRGRAELTEDVQEKIRGLSLFMKNQTGREFNINEEMASTVEVIKVVIPEFTAKSRSKA